MDGVRLISATRVGVDDLSRPVYQLRYNFPIGTFATQPTTVNKTFSFSQGRLLEPTFKGSALGGLEGDNDPVGSGGDISDLQKRKDLWLQSVARNPLLTPEQKAELSGLIDGYSGGLLGLNNMVSKYIESATATGPEIDPFNIDDLLAGLTGGGGGGGGGSIGPTYREPDARAVEDYVKGVLVSLTGTVDESLLSDGVAVFMRDHRRNFDSPGRDIDPQASVLEFIRNTNTYQEIHALRPESEDERTWISQRRAAGARGGLQQGLQEDFAITQATIGGDLPDVQDAGAVAQVQASGSTRGTTLETKIKNTAISLFNGVR